MSPKRSPAKGGKASRRDPPHKSDDERAPEGSGSDSDGSDLELEQDWNEARLDAVQKQSKELAEINRDLAGDDNARRKRAARRKRDDGDEDYDPKEEREMRRSGRIANQAPAKYVSDSDDDARGSRRRRNTPREPTFRRPYVFPAEGLGSCEAPPPKELRPNLETKRALGLYDKERGVTCHQCRQKTTDRKTACANTKCQGTEKGHLCGRCLYDRYGENIEEVWANPAWTCPVCRGFCNCSFCWQDLTGSEATGALAPRARKLGYRSVAHYLADDPRIRPPDLDRSTLMQPGRSPPQRDGAPPAAVEPQPSSSSALSPPQAGAEEAAAVPPTSSRRKRSAARVPQEAAGVQEEATGGRRKRGRAAAKAQPPSEGAEAGVTEERFEIERIVDERRESGKRQFLVKWKGYGPEHDSWEPEGSLAADCPAAVKAFLARRPAGARRPARPGARAASRR